MSLLIHNARILTLAGDPTTRRGPTTGDLATIDRAWVRIEDGTIAEVGTDTSGTGSPAQQPAMEAGSPAQQPTRGAGFPARHQTRGAGSPARHQNRGAGFPARHTIDAQGRVLIPAFTDCHTHLCWAGQRLDEWERKLAGATYLEILASGGGILSTVRAVRAASERELTDHLTERLAWLLREGTTTVEIKSGYGLDTPTELKMLRAIVAAGGAWPGTVVPTACIGHAIDPDAKTDADRAAFVRRTIDDTLPAVTAEFPGIAIDAYCEQGAWGVAECVELFDRAQTAGHTVRVHADQFNPLGLLPEAVSRGYRSVDHLEATTDEGLRTLAASETFGVMLPCAGFHTDGRYGDGRAFLDAGGRLAIATNTNPGSAPCQSMPMAIALATRHNGLTPAEAIACATVMPAALLGLTDRGRVEPGCRADLVLLRHTDERALAFEFGGDPTDAVVCAGEIVKNLR